MHAMGAPPAAALGRSCGVQAASASVTEPALAAIRAAGRSVAARNIARIDIRAQPSTRSPVSPDPPSSFT